MKIDSGNRCGGIKLQRIKVVVDLSKPEQNLGNKKKLNDFRWLVGDGGSEWTTLELLA